jgi:hypothetical protein
VHKNEQQQGDHNQDHPHNRPNNQTGHIDKGVVSMTAYYGSNQAGEDIIKTEHKQAAPLETSC